MKEPRGTQFPKTAKVILLNKCNDQVYIHSPKINYNWHRERNHIYGGAFPEKSAFNLGWPYPSQDTQAVA